jgi:hypothetical protein
MVSALILAPKSGAAYQRKLRPDCAQTLCSVPATVTRRYSGREDRGAEGYRDGGFPKANG